MTRASLKYFFRSLSIALIFLITGHRACAQFCVPATSNDCGPLSGTAGLLGSNTVCNNSTVTFEINNPSLADSIVICYADGQTTTFVNPAATFQVPHLYAFNVTDTCPSPLPNPLTVNVFFYRNCISGQTILTVSTYPIIRFRPNPIFSVNDTVCVNQNVTINVSSPPVACANAWNPGNSTSYFWNRGNGLGNDTTPNSIVNTYVAPSSYSYPSAGVKPVLIKAWNICGVDSFKKNVVVLSIADATYTPQPLCASPNIVTATISCNNYNGNFHIVSVTPFHAGSTYSIVKNDTTHPQFRFPDADTFIVCYAIRLHSHSLLCSYCDTVIILRPPYLTVSQSILDTCFTNPFSIAYSNYFDTLTGVNQSNAFTVAYNGSVFYTWSGGNALPPGGFNITQTGTYTISGTASNPCQVVPRVLTINVCPPLDSVTMILTTCTNDTVYARVYPTNVTTYAVNTVPPNASGFSVIGGNTANPKLLFSDTGTFIVRFYSCGCFLDKTITVTQGVNLIQSNPFPSGCAIGLSALNLAGYISTSNNTTQTNNITLYHNSSLVFDTTVVGIPSTSISLSPGTYDFSVIGVTPCNSDTITISFNLDTATVLQIQSDTQVCLQINYTLPVANGATVIYNGQVYTQPSIYIAADTQYVVAFVPLCGDTVYQTIHGIGTSATAQDDTVCNNASTVTLQASPAGGTFAGTFVTGSQMNVTTAGFGNHPFTYTLTSNVSGHTCNYTSNAQITVLDTINTLHTLPANGCVGQAVALVNQSGNNLSINYGDNASFTTSTQHTYITEGTYTITMIFGVAVCADTIQETILIYPLPVAKFAMNDTSLCLTQTETPVIISTVTATDSVVWKWRGVNYSTPPSITGDNTSLTITAEWLYLEVYSEYCGYAIDSHQIIMYPKPVPHPGLIFSGHCTPLYVCFANNSVSPPNTIYVWYLNGSVYYNGNTPPCTSIIADTVRVYYTFVLAAISECDTVYDTVGVYVDPPGFTIALSMANTVKCQNETFSSTNYMPYDYLLTYYLQPDSVFTTHGDTTVTFSFSQSGTHTVMVVVTNGCSYDTAYFTVNVLPIPMPLPTATGGGCLDSIVWFHSGINDADIIGIFWSYGDGQYNAVELNPVHIYENAGTYSPFVITQGLNGCWSDTTKFDVQISKPPKAVFKGDTLVCTPVSLILSVDSATSANALYRFYITHDGITDSTESANGILRFGYQAGGEYYILVRVMDNNDPACYTLIGTYKVTVVETPVADFYTKVADGNVLKNTYNVINISSTAGSYLWNFGDGTFSTEINPSHTYNDQGNHTIILVASNLSCTDTAYKSVCVDYQFALFVPNAFTPNGDGNNDVFEIHGTIQLLHFVEIQIFTRWGEMVFESNNYNFQWDGIYKGALLEPQVFVYYLKGKFPDCYDIKKEIKNTYKGSLTLIK